VTLWEQLGPNFDEGTVLHRGGNRGTFDIRPDPPQQKHVAFGHGPHFWPFGDSSGRSTVEKTPWHGPEARAPGSAPHRNSTGPPAEGCTFQTSCTAKGRSPVTLTPEGSELTWGGEGGTAGGDHVAILSPGARTHLGRRPRWREVRGKGAGRCITECGEGRWGAQARGISADADGGCSIAPSPRFGDTHSSTATGGGQHARA